MKDIYLLVSICNCGIKANNDELFVFFVPDLMLLLLSSYFILLCNRMNENLIFFKSQRYNERILLTFFLFEAVLVAMRGFASIAVVCLQALKRKEELFPEINPRIQQDNQTSSGVRIKFKKSFVFITVIYLGE